MANELTIRTKSLPRAIRGGEPDSGGPTSSSVRPNTSAVDDILAQLSADRRVIENLLSRVDTAIQNAERGREAFRSEWRQAAVELAVAIAARILRRQISADQFPIDAIAAEMCARLPDSERITVFLNPTDLARIRERSDETHWAGRSIHFQSDESLQRGDCRVDDGERVLLSRLNSQLMMLRDASLRELSHD